MLREPSGLVHPAKICLAARIGRSEMGEGPTNPMAPGSTGKTILSF
jgi:hypothetical protein